MPHRRRQTDSNSSELAFGDSAFSRGQTKDFRPIGIGVADGQAVSPRPTWTGCAASDKNALPPKYRAACSANKNPTNDAKVSAIGSTHVEAVEQEDERENLWRMMDWFGGRWNVSFCFHRPAGEGLER